MGSTAHTAYDELVLLMAAKGDGSLQKRYLFLCLTSNAASILLSKLWVGTDRLNASDSFFCKSNCLNRDVEKECSMYEIMK